MTKGDKFFIFRLNLNMAIDQIVAGVKMLIKLPRLLWKDLT